MKLQISSQQWIECYYVHCLCAHISWVNQEFLLACALIHHCYLLLILCSVSESQLFVEFLEVLLQERIKYKVISITYKLLQFSSPRYLRNLITVQPSWSTQTSALVTLQSSPTISWLQYQDHKQLFLVSRTSPVEQASSYSLCSLSVRSFIISQLFSIIIFWS